MKKLVFLFVAFAAVSFASCGGNKASNSEEVASDSVVAATVIEEATPACDSTKACCGDSTACDSTKACCDKAE